jgi:hypothetical protein
MDLLIKNKHIDQLTLSYVGEPKENPLAYMYAYNNKSIKLMSDKGNPNNKHDIDFMFELCKKAGRRKNVVFEVVICNNNGEDYALTNDICNMCIANDVVFSTFDIVSDPNEVVEIKPLSQKQTKSSHSTVKNTNPTIYQQKTNSYKKNKKRQPTGDFPDFIKDALQKKKERDKQDQQLIAIKNPDRVQPPIKQAVKTQVKAQMTDKTTKKPTLIDKYAFFITGNPDGVNTTHVQQYTEKLITKYGKEHVVIIGGGTNKIEFVARDMAILHGVQFIDIPLKSSDKDSRGLQIRKIAYTLSQYKNAEIICFHVGDGFGAQNDLIDVVKEVDGIKIYYPKSERDDLFADDAKKLHFRSKIRQENPNFVINKEQNENFVIITGDFGLRNYEAFSYLVNKYIDDKKLTNISIITAHNDGVDSMARRYAIEYNYGLYTFVPNLLSHDTNIKDVMCNMANLSWFCYEHVHHHALVITTGKVQGTKSTIKIIHSKNINPDIYLCPLKKYVAIDSILSKEELERKPIVVEDSWV